MKRIDTATKSVDKHGSGKHGFTDGVPPSTTAPTRLNAAWFDAVQEELASPIEGVGMVLDEDDRGQLLGALQRIAVDNALSNLVHETSLEGVVNAPSMINDGAAIKVAVSELGTTRVLRRVIVVSDESGVSPCTSDDLGKTWTQRTSSVSEPDGPMKIASNGETAVIVGYEVSTGDTPKIFSTSDGVTYTSQTVDDSFNGKLNHVHHGGGLFVTGGSAGEVQISPDGAAWTSQTTPDTDTEIQCGVYAEHLGLHVLAGKDGATSIVWTSPDGVIWTKYNGILWNNTSLTTAAYNGEAIVIMGVSATGDHMTFRSTDGESWDLNLDFAYLLPLNNSLDFTVKSLTALGGVFIASGHVETHTTPVILASFDDGLTWKPRNYGRLGVIAAGASKALISTGENLIFFGGNGAATSWVSPAVSPALLGE